MPLSARSRRGANVRCGPRWIHGVHVMRIAEIHRDRPPFVASGPCAYARGDFRSRLGSLRTPVAPCELSTRTLPTAHFFEPEDEPDDFCNATKHGHQPRKHRILDRDVRRRASRSTFTRSPTLRRATSIEPRSHAHPLTRVRARVRRPTDPSEGSRAFRYANPLLEPVAHLLSCVHARKEDGSPFRFSCPHRTDAPRERDTPVTIDLLFHADPRR